MKKFLLFGYDAYYPSGGWNDFEGSFDTIDEAKENAASGTQFHDIVDRDLEAVVLERFNVTEWRKPKAFKNQEKK